MARAKPGGLPPFEGFSPDFLKFFRELSANNDRAWFEANKDRYRGSVVDPMLSFIAALESPVGRISPQFLVIPKAHGGSLFRIYRDTRFSADKTPYKTHAAAHLRHAAGKDAHAPGFYVHFGPEGLHWGGGIWLPPSAPLRAIREFIADNPAAWRRLGAAKAVRDRGGLQGEQLKRPPRGFDPEHEHVDDLRRKSFYLMEEAKPATLRDPDLVKRVTAGFRAAAPLNHFLCDALGLPFET